MPTISFGKSSQDANLKLFQPNIISSITNATIANRCESLNVSRPLIWDGTNDSYYENIERSFYDYVGSRAAIEGGTVEYRSEPDLTPQSYIKVANMLDDCTIKYYSSLDPGTYSPGPQETLAIDGTIKSNETKGYIAGRLEKISVNLSNSTFSSPNYSYATSSTKNSNTQVVSLTYSPSTTISHNLITGNAVRCISVGTSNLELNKIYYVIRLDSTSFKLADSYTNAVAVISMTVTDSSSVEFERQSGWIRVEEGSKRFGNGGSPYLPEGGTGNKWIRNPYSLANNKTNLLSSYINTTAYSEGDRVIYQDAVWECLSSQDSSNAVEPSYSTAVEADYSGAHGNVMLEIPELYMRKDYFDGAKWFNIKGVDVSKDYTLINSLSGSTLNINPLKSSNSDKQKLHIFWLITKFQYNNLSTQEKAKYVRHPGFIQSSDGLEERRFVLSASEAANVAPTAYLIDAEGGGAVESTIIFSHYASDLRLKVGKSFVFEGGYPGLENGTTYYIKEVIGNTGSKKVKVSLTPDGPAIKTAYAVVTAYYTGTMKPILTNTRQDIVSVNSSTFKSTVNHQLLEGQKVRLYFSGSLSNFSSGGAYYICNPDYVNKTFQLCSSLSNLTTSPPTVINSGINSNFSNDAYILPVIAEELNYEQEITGITNSVLSVDWYQGFSSHNFAMGDAVVYRGNVTGLQNGQIYYVSSASLTDSTLRLASTYMEAYLGQALTISGSVVGSTLKRADRVEQYYPGYDHFSLLTVNNEAPANTYRARYKALFLAGVEEREITVNSFTTTSNQPLTFTVNSGHGLVPEQPVDVVILGGTLNGIIPTTGGYISHQMYYVKVVSKTQFTLSSDLNSVPINYTGHTGTLTIKILARKPTSRKTEGSNLCANSIWSASTTGTIELRSGKTRARYQNYNNILRTGNQVCVRHGHWFEPGSSIVIQEALNNNNSTLFTTNQIRDFNLQGDVFVRFVSSSNTDILLSTVYKIVDINITSNTFRLTNVNNNTRLTFTNLDQMLGSVLVSAIFGDLEPRIYYVNVKNNSDITLHKTFSDSLSNNQPVTFSQQYPKSSTTRLNSVESLSIDGNIYGTLTKPSMFLPSMSRYGGWHSGDIILLNALHYLAAFEVRTFGRVGALGTSTTNNNGTAYNPFNGSCRIALHHNSSGSVSRTHSAMSNVVLAPFNPPRVGAEFPNIISNSRYYTKNQLSFDPNNSPNSRFICGSYRGILGMGLSISSNTNTMSGLFFGYDGEDLESTGTYLTLYTATYLRNHASNGYGSVGFNSQNDFIADSEIIMDYAYWFLHR